MLDNAHTTKGSFYVTVISCDLGMACFSVHGSLLSRIVQVTRIRLCRLRNMP